VESEGNRRRTRESKVERAKTARESKVLILLLVRRLIAPLLLQRTTHGLATDSALPRDRDHTLLENVQILAAPTPCFRIFASIFFPSRQYYYFPAFSSRQTFSIADNFTTKLAQ
jgi:hypothetical protein